MSNDGDNKLTKSQKQLADDFQTVFSTKAGKRVLFYLMSTNFVLQPTSGKSFNQGISNINEGRRECVLDIMARIKYSPEKLMQLLKESDYDEGDHI